MVDYFRGRMVTVQSTVDTGHEDMIHDAQMDFYGTRLATCSRSANISTNFTIIKTAPVIASTASITCKLQ